MNRSLAVVATVGLLWGCGGGGETPPDGTSSSPVTTWPTFTGDCTAPWDHVVTAINSNAYSNPDPLIGFSLQDRVEGEQGPRAYLSLDFDPAAVGQALNVDKSAGGKQVKFVMIIDSPDAPNKSTTTYSQFDNGVSGGVHGTVTVKSYDAAGGTAEILFTNAALIGQDAVYAGNFRCGVNGTLKVSAFKRTALGASCQSDLECGGGYSGRVCDNNSFKCAQGCHQAEDCPLGRTCNPTSSTCS
jgi:hypothetical protein